MNIRIQISKKLILRLAFFLSVLAVAIVLDIYFDNNSIEIKTVEDEPKQTADEYAAIYMLGQSSNVATKISIQKSSNRKLLAQHDKFLQKYHDSKNFREYKVEGEEYRATPLFLTFQHLLLRNCYISAPDDPLIS